jgi:hypothetical protein
MMNIAVIEKPDEVACTMQFKMKLKNWKQIRKTLQSNAAYTELQIINDINDLVYQLEKTLYAESK